jgi:hypothetical protein
MHERVRRWRSPIQQPRLFDVTTSGASAAWSAKKRFAPFEPDDLVALTVEAAAMARVPLAGTDRIPGANGRS